MPSRLADEHEMLADTNLPVDTGDGNRKYNQGIFVVLALEIAATRLGVPFDHLLIVTNVCKALAKAEQGLFVDAIRMIDDLRLKDCRDIIPD